MARDHNKNSPSNEDGGGDDGNDSDSTPPKAPTGTVEDVVVSSSFTETSGRKRGRGEEQGGGSSSSGAGQKGKKKGELTDPPSTDPKCFTCGKAFGSWKAVFGHLRSHPERDYRGAFPPPKIWEEMIQQEAAQRQHGRDQGSSTTAMEGFDIVGTAASGSRGIGIDLNDPEEPQREEFPFDLNVPAPESEDDDDNES